MQDHVQFSDLVGDLKKNKRILTDVQEFQFTLLSKLTFDGSNTISVVAGEKSRGFSGSYILSEYRLAFFFFMIASIPK